ncbi:hypothetical protein CBER1_01842 [Cercospora berteroae]|uniref:Uncharacterized protein n=1 Tax=Cercospora berteroae TaxID=357750 RepID=A0A2S6CA26_9PEZI|nr:hypothetical protein CBER1_01842 [Cercospora berteroae]
MVTEKLPGGGHTTYGKPTTYVVSSTHAYHDTHSALPYGHHSSGYGHHTSSSKHEPHHTWPTEYDPHHPTATHNTWPTETAENPSVEEPEQPFEPETPTEETPGAPEEAKPEEGDSTSPGIDDLLHRKRDAVAQASGSATAAQSTPSCPAPGSHDSQGRYSCNPAHQYPAGQICDLVDGCYFLRQPGPVVSVTASSYGSSSTGTAGNNPRCDNLFDQCRGAPDANRAFCASQYAECLGYNPFTENGSSATSSQATGTQGNGYGAATTTHAKPSTSKAKSSAPVYGTVPVYGTAPVSSGYTRPSSSAPHYGPPSVTSQTYQTQSVPYPSAQKNTTAPYYPTTMQTYRMPNTTALPPVTTSPAKNQTTPVQTYPVQTYPVQTNPVQSVPPSPPKPSIPYPNGTVTQPAPTYPVQSSVTPPVETHPVQPPIETHPVQPPVQTYPVQPPVETHPVQPPVETHPVQPPVQTYPPSQPPVETHPAPPAPPQPTYPAQSPASSPPTYAPPAPSITQYTGTASKKMASSLALVAVVFAFFF